VQYILHYLSRVHSRAVYNLTLSIHFSNYIMSLSVITSFSFLLLFYCCPICADSVIQVQCLYLLTPLCLVMWRAPHSLFPSIRNIVWWIRAYPCG
jgi:hypothetical protein